MSHTGGFDSADISAKTSFLGSREKERFSLTLHGSHGFLQDEVGEGSHICWVIARRLRKIFQGK